MPTWDRHSSGIQPADSFTMQDSWFLLVILAQDLLTLMPVCMSFRPPTHLEVVELTQVLHVVHLEGHLLQRLLAGRLGAQGHMA
jgi:hypothetical protein